VRKQSIASVPLFTLLFTIGLLAVSAAGAQTVFPGESWETSSPEAHGLDAAKLARAAEAVRSIEERYGFLVVKNGVIVHESYFLGDQDSLYPIYSAAKSFASTLVGIAQTKGLLNVKDKVADWMPIHQPGIAEGATIEHVLTMTAAGEPPGSRFHYASGSNNLNILPNILWLASGMSPYEFYRQELAAPLHLSLEWPHTEKGWLQIGTQFWVGMGPVYATHRDMARLGLLWLNQGRWGDQQLVAKEYIRAATSARFPQANTDYGYLWWLNTTDSATPTNGYQARGGNGQLIIVVPDEDIVVVTMGNTLGLSDDATRNVWQAILSFLDH
jgi:CubicO group peptidase (beta-lactamase class C family)